MLTRPSGSSLPSLAAVVTVALFLSMQFVEGMGVHRCAAHDAGAGFRVGPGESSAHHHGGSTHHGQEGDDNGHTAGCPCLGDCQSSPATAASATAAGPAPSVVVAGALAIESRESLRSVPRHLLPFANGPPLIA